MSEGFGAAGDKDVLGGGRKQDRAGLVAPTPESDLSGHFFLGCGALLQGAPVRVGDFGDESAAYVEEAEERVVVQVGLKRDNALEFLLRKYALRRMVGWFRA